MKSTRIFLLVLIILGIILLLTQESWVPKLVSNIIINENTPAAPAETSSIKGCYVAKLSRDIYTLSIQSEKSGVVDGILAFNNFEKDSSSGTFSGTFSNNILLGDYSFDSEGMHSDRQVIFKKMGGNFIEGFGPVKTVSGKEIFENTSNVTYDPKSTFIKSDNCVAHFTESNNVFAFAYNSLFPAYAGNSTLTADWRLNATQNGVLLATVVIPRGFMPKTNFSEAKFTVGRSSDAKEIKSCFVLTDYSGKSSMGTTEAIDGYPFKKFTFGGAAAGNYFETSSYRGIVDGDCYAIEYTIHTTNLGNYSPDQGIKEFNKSLIQNDLEKIVKSFKFLVKSY